jgi:hypothetical protein
MSKIKLHYIQITLVILVIIIFVLGYKLYTTSSEINSMHNFNASRLHIKNLTRKNTLTSNDAHIIESWMTFDYINTAFHLPPDYLKTNLEIPEGSSFPRISIKKYASLNKIDSVVLTQKIIDLVKAYNIPSITK